MLSAIHKYILSVMMLTAAATAASAAGFTGLCGEKDGMVWSIDPVNTGRFIGTSVVLHLGNDIAAMGAKSGIESVAADSAKEITLRFDASTGIIYTTGASPQASWALFTIDGRTVAHGIVSNNTIDCSTAATGAYIINIADSVTHSSQSSIIIKK